LDEWPEVGAGLNDGRRGAESAYWWLKGAAVLAASLMPRWARATWRRLGHEGEPRLSAFWQTPPPIDAPTPASGRRFEPLDVATVRQLTGVGSSSD
jgi:hypothetical protein